MKQDNIAYLIHDVARLVRRRFDERTRSLGVTGPQMRALLSIERNPGINQGLLAERLDVEPITTCRMVDRLEQAGLVERRRDPQDRRAWRLHLTEAASPVVGRMQTISDAILAEALPGLDDSDQAELAAHLSTIRENLNRGLAAAPAERRAPAHG